MPVIEWDIGIAVLSQYDTDDFLEVQYDGEGDADSGVAPYEAHHFHGFMSRPLDPVVDDNGVPDPTTAHQLLYGLEGGKGHALVLQNPAIVKELPLLKKGEALFYGGKHQFIRAMEDGGFGVWAPSASGGIDFSGTFGDDGIFFSGRWGTFELSDNGFHVKHSSGARIDIGAIGGFPAPLSAIGSYAKLAAGSIDLNATAVTSGPDTTTPVSLVGATELASLLNSIALALTAINAALGSALPISGITTAQVTAVTAALPPAILALSAALATPGFATNAKATI